MAVDVESVLRLSRRLHRVTTVEQLIDAVREAVASSVGFRTTWLGLLDKGSDPMVEIILASGPGHENITRCPRFPSKGDAMLAEIIAARAPVVVVDARTDPRTDKQLVARVGNRTIVNVPLLLGDDLLGAMGVGTFAPEEPRAPSSADIENLAIIATQVAAALHRVQLLQSQAAIQRQLQGAQRFESLAVLASGVAHDFNNLLTVILGSLELARPDVDPGAGELLDGALDAARRGAQLTRQLLALARRQPMELVSVDVAVRIGAVLDMARRLLPESIAISADISTGLPPVLADPPQFDQVMLNLFVNARDAMPEGGQLAVHVSMEAASETDRMVRITVQDNGVGMPPEVLEHVLEPFFTTKPVGQGTGLGLSMAAGIVEQHGGKIRVQSTLGVGTTFEVLLPAFEGAARNTPVCHLAARVPHGFERILLAEDEQAVRSIAQRVLAASGYRVTTVADGHEAIETARRDTAFDLIVLDAVMPRVSGRQAWEEISALQPAARFLIVSGHSSMTFRPHEVPFLEKPYTPEMLLNAVSAALQRPATATRIPA